MSTSSRSPSLQSRLAQALPSSIELLIHYVVSEELACPEVFAATPGQPPEPTKSESHFLSASIKHDGQALQVFALEVYVYETSTLTTIFVSKADSTGYLHLLNLEKGTPSPIKTVITTFLDWLVEQKRRKDARLLLSLFARAQNQYLFPGSIENSGKHVLDDRGLIRWWCRVLDPILLRYEEPGLRKEFEAHAHLIVPGLDPYETRSYFPKPMVNNGTRKPRWVANDPLHALGKPADLPARCYIPRFPDDPKSRFVLDLDDELPDEPETEGQVKGKSPGLWKSVRSLVQFWELMAYRQECSAGRVVGFVWVVFEPVALRDKPLQAQVPSKGSPKNKSKSEESSMPTPTALQQHYMDTVEALELASGPAVDRVRESRVSPLPSSEPGTPEPMGRYTEKVQQRPSVTSQPSANGQATRTGIKLNDKAYRRTILLLESLDYANLDLCLESTRRFIQAAGEEAGFNHDWGFQVKGQKTSAGDSKQSHTNGDTSSVSSVNVIGKTMVRSKKRSVEEVPSPSTEVQQTGINVLSAGSVRKKPKLGGA